MKQETLFRLTLLTIVSSSLPAQADDIIVIGTPLPSSPTSLSQTDTSAMSRYYIEQMEHAARVEAGRSMYEAIQRQRQVCDTEKARIQREFSNCQYTVSQWNTRAVVSCSDLRNSSWSFGGGVQVKFALFDISYTVSNPSYDQCIHVTTALEKQAEKHCDKLKSDAMLALVSASAICK